MTGLSSRVDDDSIAIQGNGRDTDGRDENGSSLHASDQFTHDSSQRPVLEGDLDQRKGHCEDTEEKVGDGKVDDVDIPPGSHRRLSDDSGTD